MSPKAFSLDRRIRVVYYIGFFLTVKLTQDSKVVVGTGGRLPFDSNPLQPDNPLNQR